MLQRLRGRDGAVGFGIEGDEVALAVAAEERIARRAEQSLSPISGLNAARHLTRLIVFRRWFLLNVWTIMYVRMRRIEWDEAKNKTNRRKHGVDFETALLVFDDPSCVTFLERVSDGEERWHAIGSIEDILIFVVVHTYCEEGSEEVIRIISARRATSHERKLYAQAIQ